VLDLFVTRDLHVSASLYVLMDATFRAARVVGAVALSLPGPKIGAARVFSFSLVAIGVYSRSTTLRSGADRPVRLRDSGGRRR